MSANKCGNEAAKVSSPVPSCDATSQSGEQLLGPASDSSNVPETQPKKVCFICGSYTSQTIDIYEPRAGPNIIDVINAKFKVPPLNDDKYLCYSCNNWLINWHSVQNQNEAAAASSSSSSSSAAACNNKSNQKRSAGAKYTRRNTSSMHRSLVPHTHQTASSGSSISSMQTITTASQNRTPSTAIVQGGSVLPYTPITPNDAHNNDSEYFGGCLQTLELRAKLAKYLYRPKTIAANPITISNESTQPPDSASIKIDRHANRPLTQIQSVQRPRRVAFTAPIECNLCGKPMLLRPRRLPVSRRYTSDSALLLSQRCVRFCRNCRRALHKYYFRGFVERTRAANENRRHHVMIVNPLAEETAAEKSYTMLSSVLLDDGDADLDAESKSKVVNPYVLSRLKKLGTTVVREEDESMDEDSVIIPTETAVVSSTTPSAISHLQVASPLLFSSLSHPSSYVRHQNHHRTTQNPSMMSIDEIQSWPSERNEKNEIVLAFDETLKEVFPSSSCRAVVQQHSSAFKATADDISMVRKTAVTGKPTQHEDVFMVDDIYSRIPKTLSITLLST